MQGVLGRGAGIESTRADLAGLGRGARPAVWPELVDAGLLALHLPESAGGAGAGLTALAVVAEAAGEHLMPGPWLPSVLTSATLAVLADGHPALEELAAGATGALATGLQAHRTGVGFRLEGTSAPALGLPGAEHVLLAASDPDGVLLWFLVPAERLTVQVGGPVDLTRSIGQVQAPPEGLLLGPPSTAWRARWE